jgi:hypothetical protein
MSKKRAIEIVQDLMQTINKMEVKSIITKSGNSIFKHPSVSKTSLIRKKDKLIKKYNLNKKEYGITKNEG